MCRVSVRKVWDNQGELSSGTTNHAVSLFKCPNSEENNIFSVLFFVFSGIKRWKIFCKGNFYPLKFQLFAEKAAIKYLIHW